MRREPLIVRALLQGEETTVEPWGGGTNQKATPHPSSFHTPSLKVTVSSCLILSQPPTLLSRLSLAPST